MPSSIYLKTASSSSYGLFVAAITNRRCSEFELTPSNSIRNSVFSRRLASDSSLPRFVKNESTSSTKIMDGYSKTTNLISQTLTYDYKLDYRRQKFTCNLRAIANNALTNFSLSPTYFEVILAALMLKKVMSQAVATPLASNVLPFPGGPNSKSPRAGVRKPVNNSGCWAGRMMISRRACLATWRNVKINTGSNILSKRYFGKGW